jgi:hypothetical protein
MVMEMVFAKADFEGFFDGQQILNGRGGIAVDFWTGTVRMGRFTPTSW